LYTKREEIDPKKVESIRMVQEPACKCDVQKLLGKINYLRRFIANLVGKVDSILPLIRLKHESEFVWGDEQRRAFERIKAYLTSPPVLQAPRADKDCRLYITTQNHVMGAVLTQENKGKEFAVAYLSRKLFEAEGRYTFFEKLCLSLYYACTKLHRYLLTRSCIVVCQHNVIKCMLQKPISSGKLGKWAYALVEYDLGYESLKAMKGQVVADFIIDHGVELEDDMCLNDAKTWTLFFDGSVYS
jgi:hypothetical protein